MFGKLKTNKKNRRGKIKLSFIIKNSSFCIIQSSFVAFTLIFHYKLKAVYKEYMIEIEEKEMKFVTNVFFYQKKKKKDC